ncbi:alpha/beta hydrolase [Kitasatospora sp. NPDC096147]|uniref:alpha/beta hydrolase n=1 Tax=Kitasatospora sp. NPDC096147 TaxID=3364093 RepID=UPI003819BD05
MRNRLATLATATAVTAALLGLAAPGATAAARPAWGDCPGQGLDPRQRCTTVEVPLDHAVPDGPTITLAVSRIPAERPELRRGVLLMVPGGPGGGAVDWPGKAAKQLPREVRERYDLIGFDPRGVGRSTPVSCGLAHEDLSMTKLRPWPAADGSTTANTETARRVAETCLRNGGPVLRSLSTANEARDIDRIRQALGERKLSLWGISYGTYAGAVYSTMYPQRTDRVLLDSNDDPDPAKVGRGWLAAFGPGAEDRFPDFARWAAAPDSPLRLAERPEQVRPLFLELAARLDREPLPWPGANPAVLDGNALREALLNALYDDERFPGLARLIADGLARRTPAAPQLPPDAALQNTVAVSVGVLCNDVAWPRDPAGYTRAVADSRAKHPLTAGMPVNVMPCAFWPAPAEPPVRITPAGPPNVLLVQNLRDPATPYAGALKLRQAFGQRARMVAVDSGGHDVYAANGNACGDRLATDFLTTGRRPARDAFCPAEELSTHG